MTEHLLGDVPGDAANGLVAGIGLSELGDGVMAEIVEA